MLEVGTKKRAEKGLHAGLKSLELAGTFIRV
jgi:hypothetical protein